MRYTYRFAGAGHEPIKSMRQLRQSESSNYDEGEAVLGLYANGTYVGRGSLLAVGKKSVHTDFVELADRYRRKGHGIHLYKALIKAAKAIGAKRIYSSTTLNEKSERMWSEKLPAAGFKVRSRRVRQQYDKRKKARIYFIDL